MNRRRTVRYASDDPLISGISQLVGTVFGPDRLTRARTAAILLIALMYVITCFASFYMADIGLMRPFAPRLLVATAIPAYVIFFALVRSGRTLKLADPSLMVPQNLFALLAISFAYTAMGPHDRGLVLVFIPLVMVFGMYTHIPMRSVQVGLAAIILLGVSMGVLSHIDPGYYPPQLELIRFELMIGAMPALIFTAYQIASWRNKLSKQRKELKVALEQVQKLATHDSLTGLCNRRHMQEKLDKFVMRFDRYGERFTVVLIDLDHFKSINDRYGHRVGDECLQSFASAALAVLRDTDTIARWGGEEFLMLMPNTSADKALVALKRLSSALSNCTLSSTVPELKMTFSAGVAIHDIATAINHTVERADKALYRAKNNGRDQFAIAPSA